MKVEFAFELSQKVKIVLSDRLATVIGLWIDKDAIRWAYVEYVRDNNEISGGWFREETELVAAE